MIGVCFFSIIWLKIMLSMKLKIYHLKNVPRFFEWTINPLINIEVIHWMKCIHSIYATYMLLQNMPLY